MKNSNLLNRLLSYSHEKQSPQRFGRYAVMLIMLLTLGVGQMWGAGQHNHNWQGKVYFRVPNNWDVSTYKHIQVGCARTTSTTTSKYQCFFGEMTNISHTHLYYKSISVDHSSWNQYEYIFFTANTSNYDNGDFTVNTSHYYTTPLDYGPNNSSNYYLFNPKTEGNGPAVSGSWNSTRNNLFKLSNTIAVKVKKAGSDSYVTPSSATEMPATSISVTAYYLNGDNSSTSNTVSLSGTTYSNSFYGCPGGEITLSQTPKSGYQFDGYYVSSSSISSPYYPTSGSAITIEARYTEIASTVTLTASPSGKGSFTIGGAAATSTTAGVTTTRSVTAVPISGYHFVSWAISGGATISSTTANPTTVTGDGTGDAATLTATFAEDASNYTLTFGAGSNGSVAAKNTSTSAALVSGNEYEAETGVTVTATPNSHYHLEGWYSNSELTTPFAGAGTTNPYSFSLTSNISIYAKFALNQSAITLDRNGGTAGDESVTATYGSTLPFFTAHTRSGYTLNGYFTATSGGTKIINADGTLVASTSYADGSNRWSSDASSLTLHAQWSENMRNVTISVSPSGAGTLNKTSASVGVATTTTVTATAQPGYRFTGWTATNCSVASSSSASTTLSGNGTTGDATVVANFARTYAYLEGRMTVYNAARSTETNIASTKGGWDKSSTRVKMDYDDTNHRFYRHTYKTPAELSAQQSSNYQYFSVKVGTVDGSVTTGTVTPYEPSSNQDLTSAGGKKAVEAKNNDKHIKFNSATTDGYAILYFDEAGVWYELEHTLIYHANYAASGTSGTAPATEYYPNGFAATAAEKGDLTMTNYTFSGWNTDEHITGTSYAVGSSITMNANKDLYAVWKRSIPMDDQDATTGVSNTVYGTYNCTTLSEYTNPEKIGYTFNGWYTQEAGGGNYVISPEKELQPGVYHWTNYDNKTNEFMRYPTSTSSLYAKWTQTVTLNVNTANHGSGDNTSATIVYKATAKTSITHCTPATGYHLVGYYSAADGGTKILEANGDFADNDITVSDDDYIVGGAWVHAGATTLYAHYEPNTYDVILDVNGATTGSNQTVVATFDADMPTTQKTSGAAITAPSKTGYTFGGYYANSNGTGTQYYTSGLASNHAWDQASSTNIYAKWTANPYTITLTQSGETGYGSAGTASVSATFDAALPTIASLPTAANGYAFMGYYTDHDGEGTQYYGADGTKLVATYTTADALELFAYFKKAEITNLVAAPGVIAPGETITITPTIEPTPVAPTIVCYELQYSNGTPLPSQPKMAYDGNAVSFTAPSASATYIVQATLKTGGDCDGGTELSRRTTTFQVAGAHDVTVKYMCGDLNIKASQVYVR